MLWPKLTIVLLVLGAAAGPGGALAQGFDREYEQRAQEVVAGLVRLNGLSGWAPDAPAAWPRSDALDHDLSRASIRRVPAATWDRSSSPARLIALNLTNLNLQRTADFSGLSALRRLELSGNGLRAVNLDGDSALIHISALKNQLAGLRVGGCPDLRHLALANNQLEKLDVSANPRLETLIVSMNRLSALDVSRNPNLTILEAMNNRLAALTVSSNPALVRLRVSYNQLSELDVSRHPALTELGVRNNELTALDVSGNEGLTELTAGRNKLRRLDLSRNPRLTALSVDQNLLSVLDISLNPALETVEAQDNPLEEVVIGDNRLTILRSLNLDGCRLPLSRLAPLTGRAQNRVRFGSQENVLFERRVIAPGELLDLSGEAVINGSSTVFTVLSKKKRRVRPTDFTEEGGRIRFKSPGLYYVEMTNPIVFSSEAAGSSGQTRRFKTRVRTGAVEVAVPDPRESPEGDG